MFPETTGVGVEFQLPKTSKRIDVLLSGFNSEDQREVLIVELKQWATADRTPMDGVVETFVGGALRNVSHPSYQAWSYAQLLTDFALIVDNENINISACAFLHNMADKSELEIAHYSAYTEKAPIFTGLEGFAFQQFINERIQGGDNGEAINMLDESEVAPSKSLADALRAMIDGNAEFTLLDEQKVIYEQCLGLAKDLTSKQVVIVDGGPGTGKSVLAINLLSKFTGEGQNARYVTKNAAPRAVYEARLTGHLKKSRISTLFTGSGSFVSTSSNEYDMLIVDEAHRLGLKSGLYRNLGENQIKEIINGSNLSIYFIDELQKIHIHDAGSKSMIRTMAEELGAKVTEMSLVSQFRCGGSNEFLSWLDTLLYDTENLLPFSEDPEKFEFRCLMILQRCTKPYKTKTLKERNHEWWSYCWDWVSKAKTSQ